MALQNTAPGFDKLPGTRKALHPDGWKVGWRVLRDVRRREHMTASQAADCAGVSQGYYTQIEQGKKLPGVTVARRLGMEMGFDWRRLYGG